MAEHAARFVMEESVEAGDILGSSPNGCRSRGGRDTEVVVMEVAPCEWDGTAS